VLLGRSRCKLIRELDRGAYQASQDISNSIGLAWQQESIMCNRVTFACFVTSLGNDNALFRCLKALQPVLGPGFYLPLYLYVLHGQFDGQSGHNDPIASLPWGTPSCFPVASRACVPRSMHILNRRPKTASTGEAIPFGMPFLLCLIKLVSSPAIRTLLVR
jgi:hypothetical protein